MEVRFAGSSGGWVMVKLEHMSASCSEILNNPSINMMFRSWNQF